MNVLFKNIRLNAASTSLWGIAVTICFVLCVCNVSFALEQNVSDGSGLKSASTGGATLGAQKNDADLEKWDFPSVDSVEVTTDDAANQVETLDPQRNVESVPLEKEDASDEKLADSETESGSNDSSHAFELRKLVDSPNGLLGPGGISTSVKVLLATSVLSLAPALLLMTTSYIRVSVVMSLLRQALGAGQIPSNQVVAGLSIFLTVLIMTPVWTDVYSKGIAPYANGEISSEEALNAGQEPIRTFLWRQIEHAGNADSISVFTQYIPGAEEPKYYEDIPWRALAPAFVLSELKTAFLIGFQIFLPFLIIDVVVSCVLVSTGMMMLPPAIVSLPFKLALFVLVDGWTLVIKSLLASFAWGSGA